MKTDWKSAFYWTAWATFMVTMLLTIANSTLDSNVSNLVGGIETISPANLEHSHELLEAGLQVEDREFPVDRMISNPAYQNHLARLAAYTKKLEMHRENERKKSRGLSILGLVSAFTWLAATVINKRKNRKKATVSSENTEIK